MAICAVLRDGLLRRSEAAKLRWQDVVFQSSGARGVLLEVRRSKIDQSSAGATVFAGPAADLLAIRPTYLDPEALVFGIADGQIVRRVRASAVRVGLGDGYTGHSGRVGMGPGPGGGRDGAYRPPERRPVAVPFDACDARPVLQGPEGQPRRSGQVLRGVDG